MSLAASSPSSPVACGRKATAIRNAAIASHAASARVDLDQREGSLEVGDDVVGILTAYGDADRPFRDARRRQLLRRELAVARRAGVRDGRLEAAETRRAHAE